MYNRDHSLKETYEFYHEQEKALANKADKELKERKCEVEEFYEKLNKYRKQRELKDSELGKFTEAVYDNHMQTALEAIYITALQNVAPLTEESEEIAKSLVENYIKEHGGAREIISHNSNKTYLLDTIFEAVEKAAQKDIQAFFEAEKEDEKEKEEDDGVDDVDKEDIKLGDADGDGVDDSQDSDFGTGDDNNKNEEASDSKEDKDVEADKKEEEKENSSAENGEDVDGDGDADEDDKKDSDDDDDDEDDDEESADVEDLDSEEYDDGEDEDDDDEDVEDPDLDTPDTKDTVEDSEEVPEEDEEEEELADSKEELFDKLENDEEVSDAVDIIAKRISDAEAKFIEKNAEDKKKIENIVNKVQDRIDAVTQDEDTSEEEMEKEQEEAKLEATRLIGEVRNDRFHTVYEFMVRDNMEYIMKNQALTESYKTEDGNIDMSRVMDNSRAMYGWLETVNTIKLENVNEDYIRKMLGGQI